MTRTTPDRTVRLSAQELLDLVLDGAIESWDHPVEDPPGAEPGTAYADELARARAATGLAEAVVTGRGSIDGRPVAVIVSEFGFLAGSIGVAAAERITTAVRRATRERLPLLAAPVSGGTRMQEGTAAFVRMAEITAAVAEHKRAGLPYLVYQRHPTTGGVFASWGSLGHITVAEPDALIGFLGPKVYRALHGEEFPPGVQTGENLYAHGLVDAVLAPHHLRGLLVRVLDTLLARGAARRPGTPADDGTCGAPAAAETAWESIDISRRHDRPGFRTLLRVAADDAIGLNGTGMGESDKASAVALARIGGRGVVVVGLDRHAQSFGGPLGPGALRQARRGMRLAAELGLPLVTVIDTPGAALSRAAEEGGLGGEIARCLAALLALPVPTVSVLMGQGTGGAALALLPADRVVAARHGWLSPLPPEGASVIRHGDTSHAAAMAEAQRVNAAALMDLGFVDAIVEERPHAGAEPEAFCRRLGAEIARQIEIAVSMQDSDRDPAGRSARRAGRARTAAR
jgi:acetyl-CoA carboxylase beta subunit/acetyl-CoA carboxylase alpha subunit